MSDTLTHYGVKGMRWGVVRDDGDRSAARAARKEARKERREDRRQVKLLKENKKLDKEDASARSEIDRYGGNRAVAASVSAGAGVVGGLLVGGTGQLVAQVLMEKGDTGAAILVSRGAGLIGGLMAGQGIASAINISAVDNGYRDRYNEASGYDADRAARAANK